MACDIFDDKEPETGTPEPTGISLFPPTLTLEIGDTETLVVTVTPSNADKNVTWRSDKPAVVAVDSDGKIIAVGDGTATVYALTVVGGKQASSVITVNPPGIEPVNKYEVKDDSSNNINDRIKYSVFYGDLDYYYIYLGEMQHIPLFHYDAYNHEGLSSSYSVSITGTTKETIETTITESSQTTVSVSENYSSSTTNGGKVSAEISEKFTMNTKLGVSIEVVKAESSIGYEVAAKLAAEKYWSTVNTTGGGINNQNSKSLTNTVRNGTEKTLSTQETRSWNFSKSDKVGWYRYTLFSASDVYLYVIRDRAKPNEIYYEFREHVIPDVYFWKMDYSDNASFTKDDETRFNFNVSMLDNLPKAKIDVTPPSFEITFNSNEGSDVPKQTVKFNGTATKPDNPARVGFTFDGWCSDVGLQNLYDFSTKVLDDTTLYAKWTGLAEYTVTFDINGGRGTVPAKQTVYNGTEITLPGGSGLSKTNYAFVGWNTNNSGTGTTYYAGSSFTVSNDVSLYAKWTVTSYSESMGYEYMKGGTSGFVSSRNITSSFNIPDLKNAGYSKLSIMIVYEARMADIALAGDNITVAIMKRGGKTDKSKEEDPRDGKWHNYSLPWDYQIDNFSNSLTVSWSIPKACRYEIQNRSITITAVK
jgi:uncharacterized repeat protein (TIGR02543 family)